MQSQGEQTRYQYDAFGRRILKASEGQQTRFYWLGDSLIKEQHTSAALGTQSTTYLFEPEQGNSESFKPVALVKSDAENPQGEIYHIHTDHLGTPQEVSNEAGEVVWAAQYRAYGAVKRQLKVVGSDVSAEDRPGPSFTMNLRFMGQYFDQETGLHYNRHRYYDPECGQFTTQDPIGLMGGLNNYQYVPNPVSWVDPLGLCEEYVGLHTRGYRPGLGERSLSKNDYKAFMSKYRSDGANLQQQLDEQISHQEYVYRATTRSTVNLYKQNGFIEGRSGGTFMTTDYVGLNSEVLMDKGQIFGYWEKPEVLLKIPSSELNSAIVSRPFGNSLTVGWEPFTEVYPATGSGGIRQFLGTTKSWSDDWIIPLE